MLAKLPQMYKARKEDRENPNLGHELWSPASKLIVPLNVVQPMTCLLAVDYEIRIESVSEHWETL